MEFCGEDSYRLFYQSLAKVKHQLNPAAKQLICRQLVAEQGLDQERLMLIIRERLGDVNLVILVFVLALLTMSNHETFIAYQQVFSEGGRGTDGPADGYKREEELEQELIDLQKKHNKLLKENEQFRLANQRWAQDYDELLRNASGAEGSVGRRDKELEDRLKVERDNYELLIGKYNFMEQTLQEEREELITAREELITAREELQLAQQRRSSEDVSSTLLQEATRKEFEEVKKTKERYRLERNRYYHELDKQRCRHEAEKKQLQESIHTLESQCDRMRIAFAQISDIVYPPKATGSKVKSSRSGQKPPGHVARGPRHSSDVERDKQITCSGRRDEQVTGVTRLNGHNLVNGHDEETSSTYSYSAHVIPCTACSKEIPLDKFLEHMEQCTISSR